MTATILRIAIPLTPVRSIWDLFLLRYVRAPAGETNGSRNVVFGLDNVSLLFAGVGDANIDGVFNLTDLIDVLANGEYEDSIAGNSTWSEGDWTNDNEFDSGDLVVALASGGYVAGAAAAAVPEPAGAVLLLLGGLPLALRVINSSDKRWIRGNGD